MLPKYEANLLQVWQSLNNGQLYIVFYYVVILKCINGFIFLFVKSLLYIICALNAKTKTVIPSDSWTWSREANTIGLYLKLKT